MVKDNRSKADQETIDHSIDLATILDVNKKAIEINIEVEKQNEQVIELLEENGEKHSAMEKKLDTIIDNQRDFKYIINSSLDNQKETFDFLYENIVKIEKMSEETNKKIKEVIEKKIEDMDKNIFRLTILLGGTGVGTIFSIVQSLIKK